MVRRPVPSSNACTVATLKSFFRVYVECEHLKRDSARVLRAPKARKARPEALDRRELAPLIGAVERAYVWGRRFAGRRERD